MRRYNRWSKGTYTAWGKINSGASHSRLAQLEALAYRAGGAWKRKLVHLRTRNKSKRWCSHRYWPRFPLRKWCPERYAALRTRRQSRKKDQFTLRVVTLNCRGLNEITRRQNIYWWCNGNKIDILALQ